MDCLFCKIINGEIPSKKIYEDDFVLAFYDISPQAPIHFLVIPKCHIDSVDSLDTNNINYVSRVFLAIPHIARELGLEKGYRVITNIGENGAQSVKHLHFHVIGGEKLSERIV
ncbi:MAG: histidine triad nucleotide-binding protein [Oscillospiraceae bacterium]